MQDQYRLLLMDVDAARRGSRTKVSMAFSMGAFGLFSPQFTEVLFDDLQNQKLTHITRPEHEIVKGLKEGHYDFAVTWGNPDEALFAHEPLGRVPFLVIMNRQHPLASRSHVLLEELRDEKFIFFDAKTRPQQLLAQACRARGFAPDTTYMTNETMVMLTYLSRNMGIGAALPNEIALYDRTQFCAVRVDDIWFPLGISYLRQHLFTDGERAFLEALKRIYRMNECKPTGGCDTHALSS